MCSNNDTTGRQLPWYFSPEILASGFQLKTMLVQFLNLRHVLRLGSASQ